MAAVRLHVQRATIVWIGLILANSLLSAQTSREQPSIILISVDTLRADHLSSYSPKRRPTPNMDRLAEGGTLFSAVSSQVPLTLPSHVSMLTSTYPFENGVQDNGERLSPGAVTLATILKERGYRTGAFVGGFVLDRHFGLDQGFDTYDSSFGAQATKASDPGDIKRSGAEVTRVAMQWLKQNSKQPFFLFLHLYDLHTPYNLSADDKAKYGEGYDGELGYVDDVIGGFWKFLEAEKLVDRSLVVLTSDHGESLGDHGETTHGFFIYQSTLHVPLIIHWPANKRLLPDRSESPSALVDIVPTILSAIKVPLPASLKGRNLLQSDEGDIYSESLYPQRHFAANALTGLRRGRYKYIEAPKPELFDLEQDPQELRNLSTSKEPIAAAFRERLNQFRRARKSNVAERAPLNPDAVEKLRALGYLTGDKPARVASPLPDPKDKIADYEQYGRALGLARSGQLAEANSLLAELIKKNRDIPDVRLNLGLNLQQMGRDFEALESFRGVLAADPANAMAHFDAGLSYYNLQQLDDAQKELEAALAISPDYTKAEALLAHILVQRQRYDLARTRFTNILQRSPDDFDAHYNLGVLAALAGNWDEGVQHLRAAMAVDPNSAEAHNTLGSIRLRQHDFAEARTELQEAVRLKSDFAWAHYNLGLALRALGEVEPARSEFEKALASNPEFSAAREALDQLPPR